MLKQANELPRKTQLNFKGADGSVDFVEISNKDEMFQHNRLFSKLILNPHSGIGRHTHENESEIFYILSGEATYYDDEQTYSVKAGDVVQCLAGHNHGIDNFSDEKVEMIALIVLK